MYKRQLSFLLHDELHVAWHPTPRTRPLQAGSNSAPMSARQGPQVPGRLLHISLRHCQTMTSALFQLTSPDSTTSPARAISVAGLTVWNSLTDSFRDPALSSDRFRQLMKTNLFRRYHWVHTVLHDSALYKFMIDIDSDSHLFHPPAVDNIWAVMIVWRIRGKISPFPEWAKINPAYMSSRWTVVRWFRHSYFLCFCLFLN